MIYLGPTRFRPDAMAHYAEFTDAARRYVDNLSQFQRRGLREKPLDWRQGHPTYFADMFQLLNALRKMELEPQSRIVEVGAGAGWATEILASLNYRVDCIEPAASMIEVAKARVQSHLAHHGVPGMIDNVTWQCATLEDAVLPDGEVDAVLFFESFHHVVDERHALDKAWRALKPDGWLMILGDANWIPGNADQETAWTAEMNAFGTLESPLTHEYMMWLVEDRGFSEVTRHHAVNGLVPTGCEHKPIRTIVDLDAAYYNLVSARKRVRRPKPQPAPSPQSAETRPASFGAKLLRAIQRRLG
jgi:2-polyprenyl-3-methyl-5-hydroxy-6-metoxy-1,4-benzoquinol methylase